MNADIMETPTKGVYWQDAEVELMLRKLHEAGVGRSVMTSTHMESLSVFESVVQELAKEGFQRTSSQARSKF